MFNVFHNPLTFEKLLKWLESDHADFGFLRSFLSSSSSSSPSSLSMSPCPMLGVTYVMILSSEDWPGWSSGLCRGWWRRSARWRTQCTRRWGSTAPGWLCLVSTEITKIFGKINLTNHHCWVSHWQRCCISGQVAKMPSSGELSCKAELFV